jgi:predicted nucleic acid-binding protein
LITAVDTNVLLDLLIPDAPHAAEAETALNSAATAGAVVVSPLVYAELGAAFAIEADLRRFLDQTGMAMDALGVEGLHAAGQAWKIYNRRRGRDRRQHIISDFIIGAHALYQADCLLTRDRGIYRTYFPDLRLT